MLKAVAEEGYSVPTPIQERAIPVVLSGKDLLGCAQTGTGKTASFVLPLLQRMQDEQPSDSRARLIRTLILTPTRELATQIHESIRNYGRHLPQRSVVIFGGVPQSRQVQEIRRGCDILVATPGRLIDLMNQRIISLEHIRFFVLDEADRMLDMGFVTEVKRIISRLPQKRQTLFFSATMPPAILSLVQLLLTNPVKIEVTPPATTTELVDQSLYYVQKSEKRALLHHLLKTAGAGKSVLVFTRTKHGADRVARDLNKAGFHANALHGDKTQQARERSLQGFKDGKILILVATDIAARGIDIDELGLVVNFDLPNIPETYVHRIGRTGRAGASGKAISFCDFDEKIYLRDIQRLIGKTVPVVSDHPFHVKLMEPMAAAVATNAAPARTGGGRRYGRTFSQR